MNNRRNSQSDIGQLLCQSLFCPHIILQVCGATLTHFLCSWTFVTDGKVIEKPETNLDQVDHRLNPIGQPLTAQQTEDTNPGALLPTPDALLTTPDALLPNPFGPQRPALLTTSGSTTGLAPYGQSHGTTPSHSAVGSQAVGGMPALPVSSFMQGPQNTSMQPQQQMVFGAYSQQHQQHQQHQQQQQYSQNQVRLPHPGVGQTQMIGAQQTYPGQQIMPGTQSYLAQRAGQAAGMQGTNPVGMQNQSQIVSGMQQTTFAPSQPLTGLQTSVSQSNVVTQSQPVSQSASSLELIQSAIHKACEEELKKPSLVEGVNILVISKFGFILSYLI